MIDPASRRVGGAGRGPTVCTGVVPSAGVHMDAIAIAAPDNHFTSGPDCRVILASGGRRVDAGSRPTIRAGIIFPAGVERVVHRSAPDDHFGVSPHCCVIKSGSGRVVCAGGCPTVGEGIISPTGPDNVAGLVDPTPNDHFAASPHCRVRDPASGRVGGAGRGPTVCNGVVPSAGVQMHAIAISAPDDHLGVDPHRCVQRPASRRVGGAGRCPTVGAGIVSPAGVQAVDTEVSVASAPDDHFTASPHCRVIVSSSGCVGGAGRSPAIRAWVVPSAGVRNENTCSAPDDHFAASPHCGVIGSGQGGARGAGWSPRVINASTRGTSYYRKRVVSAAYRCHR